MTDNREQIPTVDWPANDQRDFSVFTLRELLVDKRPAMQAPERPHRIGFHSLILFTKGETNHWIDGESHSISENSLLHVCPNQPHQFDDYSDENEAIVLSFLPTMVPEGVRISFSGIDTTTLLSTVQHVWPPSTCLPTRHADTLNTLLTVLQQFQPRERTNSYLPAARFLICSTIEFALQFALDATKANWNSRLDPVFLAFAEQLELSFSVSRDAKWYALQLDCAQSTLNRVCSNATGKTPKQLIDERVALEARRELTFTSISASSIGKSLGFRESTNFAKFFKRQAGKTPDQYRIETQTNN